MGSRTGITSRGAPSRSGLLERGAALAAVDGIVAAAASGEGSLCVVEGPAGIGKTVLLEAGRERAAARGARVVHARASELERGFAYGVARQLLEPVIARRSAEERATVFEGAARPAVRVLGPSTVRRVMRRSRSFTACTG